MHPKLGGFLCLLWLLALVLLSSGPAGAATVQAAEPGADDMRIEIGSTYSFGQTPVGFTVSRTLRLVNEDKSRSMRIYGFWINQNENDQQWAITKKPDGWIPPGESAELTILFVASRPGARNVLISWYVEMRPASEEEDKDNFFSFTATAEALEGQGAP